jgi:DNA-binding NarL/FixJ family response regulator
MLQAPNTQLGIELAKSNKPDLMLMNIDLSEFDDYEA